jgi:hypothetical protein
MRDDQNVRTTLDLDEDVRQAVKELAVVRVIRQIAEAQRLARAWDAAHPREPYPQH